MSSMQEPSSESERVSQEDQGIPFYERDWLLWLIFFLIYVLVVAAIMLLKDDEVKLPIWHSVIRLFQTLARSFGAWALALEHEYNEYVGLLH